MADCVYEQLKSALEASGGVVPTLHIDYKKSRIKQYHKLLEALRTETTINDTRDFGIGRRIENLAQLRKIGFADLPELTLATVRCALCCLADNPQLRIDAVDGRDLQRRCFTDTQAAGIDYGTAGFVNRVP